MLDFEGFSAGMLLHVTEAGAPTADAADAAAAAAEAAVESPPSSVTAAAAEGGTGGGPGGRDEAECVSCYGREFVQKAAGYFQPAAEVCEEGRQLPRLQGAALAAKGALRFLLDFGDHSEFRTWPCCPATDAAQGRSGEPRPAALNLKAARSAPSAAAGGGMRAAAPRRAEEVAAQLLSAK